MTNNAPKPSDFKPLCLNRDRINEQISQLDQFTMEEQIQTLEEIHADLVQTLGKVRI